VLVMSAGRLRDSGWPGTGRESIGRLMLGHRDGEAGVADA
jgi:hypothetical protein